MPLCTHLSNDTVLIGIAILGTASVIAISYMVANNWDRQLIYWIVVACFAFISLVAAKMVETIIDVRTLQLGSKVDLEAVDQRTMAKVNPYSMNNNPYRYNRIPLQEGHFHVNWM